MPGIWTVARILPPEPGSPTVGAVAPDFGAGGEGRFVMEILNQPENGERHQKHVTDEDMEFAIGRRRNQTLASNFPPAGRDLPPGQILPRLYGR